MDAIARNGVMAQLLATMIGDTPASSDQAARAATATQIYILAGRPKEAASWLKIARQATDAPDMAVQLQDVWPMIVLSGIESDSDYNQTFPKWLDAALRDATPARREQIGNLLLVFETTGFAVPENAWTRVIDTATAERRTVPPSILLLQRLRAAAHANRRGETVLLALTLAGAENNQLPLIVAIETIRALKSVGLGADALSLARETASLLLLPPDSGDKR
jgi:hypothetical protein